MKNSGFVFIYELVYCTEVGSSVHLSEGQQHRVFACYFQILLSLLNKPCGCHRQ